MSVVLFISLAKIIYAGVIACVYWDVVVVPCVLLVNIGPELPWGGCEYDISSLINERKSVNKEVMGRDK